MYSIIDRDYCLKNPQAIIKLFGFSVFLGMLFSDKKSLLERLTEHYAAHGYPMPGKIGDAYRLSALLEYRMAGIYAAFAERFREDKEAWALFCELQVEEKEHGRLMELCRYTVKSSPNLKYVPSVRDPSIRAMLKELREIKRNADSYSLNEALEITERLESGEVNTIFDRLLKQADQSESHLFEDKLKNVEGHGTSVAKRIRALQSGLRAA